MPRFNTGHGATRFNTVVIAVLLAAVWTSGCLVVSLQPAYDGDSIAWDPALVGSWADADDNASMTIEASEWRSYRITYTYPIETGTLTGYLTDVGNDRYLDVMPSRGEDRGSFVVPIHIVLRLRRDGDRLELTPLSYQWFNERLKNRAPVPGLDVVRDQKENALIASPTARLRTWLRGAGTGATLFGATAVFTRTHGTDEDRPGARVPPGSGVRTGGAESQ